MKWSRQSVSSVGSMDGRDLVCVMADEHQVVQAVPDEEKLKKLDGLLLQLTAKVLLTIVLPEVLLLS